MIIYKYLDPTSAKKVLKSGTVLLKSPSQFNDPFDCYYYIDSQERERAINLIANYAFFNALYKGVVEDNKQLILGKANTFLLKKNLVLLDAITKKSNTYKFDKQIELFYWISKVLTGKSIDSFKADVNKRFDDIFDEIKRLSLVSCFSKNNDSILMWAHYARSHKGVCIEYEIDDENFKPVNYAKTITSFQLTKALEIVLGHKYSKKELDVKNKDYLFMINPLLTKSNGWAYEEEVRCIFTKNEANRNVNKVIDKKGKEMFLLDMPKPKAIYIGCNASKRFIGTIEKLKGNADLFIMETKDNEYAVTPKTLDEFKKASLKILHY